MTPDWLSCSYLDNWQEQTNAIGRVIIALTAESTSKFSPPPIPTTPSSGNLFFFPDGCTKWIQRTSIHPRLLKPIGWLQFYIGNFSDPLNKRDSFPLEWRGGGERRRRLWKERRKGKRDKNGLMQFCFQYVTESMI